MALLATTLLVGIGFAPSSQAATGPATPVTAAPDVPVTPAAPVTDDLEAYCASFLDHRRLVTGDRDAALFELIERLDADPAAPLAEAALLLLEASRADVADPPAWRARVRALDPDGPWSPGARRVLDRLRARAVVLDLPADAEPDALDPTRLGTFRVVGPLGPPVDPRGLLAEPQLLTGPWPARFDGLHGPLTPLDVRRSAGRALADPVGEVVARDGWVLVEAPFDAPGGGPAWIEWDFGDGAGTRVDGSGGTVLPFGGGGFPAASDLPVGSRRFAWALRGGEPEVVDLLEERTGLVRRPAVLRDGRNVLRVRVAAGASLPLAVRVLDAGGRPWGGLTSSPLESAPLGALVAARAPAEPLPRAEDPLLAMPHRGPFASAWLGLLLALDRRPLEGFEHLEFAAASGHPTLLALAANVCEASAALPGRWRRARGRELLEQARRADPEHLAVGVAWAELSAAEDRPEEALALLERLAASHREQPWSRLTEAALAARLGLLAHADAALADALRRAPNCPAALDARAARLDAVGLSARALELREASMRSAGVNARRLEALALAAGARGERERAASLWSASLARLDDRDLRLRHATWWLEVGDPRRAEALAAQLVDRAPRWVEALALQVRVAQRRGDAQREREALGALLAVKPSDHEARRRLAELGGDDAVGRFHAAHALDAAEVLAAYDADAHSGSLVTVLDDAQVWLHADGALETRTHELHHLRDHDACARMGELRLPGEVERVRVHKADGGPSYEPRLVQGGWVLPRLEPGDFVETVVHTRLPPADDGLPRTGRWFLQSATRPFVTTRWTVSVPADAGLQAVLFDGAGAQATAPVEQPLSAGALDDLRQSVTLDGGRVVRQWRRDGVPRRQRQPFAADDLALLPWVDVGRGLDAEVFLARSRADLEPLLAGAPALRAVVAQRAAARVGDEARARALHAFVAEHVERNSARPGSALDALLTREGRPELLLPALLREAGIAHELVWSRDRSPAIDDEPAPPWLRPEWIQQRLLVRVLPDDGPPAWCDPATPGLPYGVLRAAAPGARGLALPWPPRPGDPTRVVPASEPGVRELQAGISLRPDGSAGFEGSLRLEGPGGWRMARVLSRADERRRQSWIREQIAQLVPAVQLRSYGLELADPARPLEDGRAPLEVRVGGRIPALVDPRADPISLELPVAPLRLGALLAADGPRVLPLVATERGDERVRLLLELPPELALATPLETDGARAGWSHRLRVRTDERGRLVVLREFEREHFVLRADELEPLAAWCAAVDGHEAARLLLERR